MKILWYLILIDIILSVEKTLFDLNFESPYKKSKEGVCGCYNERWDGFAAPDYGDASKAGFYYRVMLEEAKQIASWWVAGANLMAERSPMKDKTKNFAAKNFKLSQVKTQSEKKKPTAGNYQAEMFTEPKYKTVNMCPVGGSIYTIDKLKATDQVFDLPWALTNTFTDVEFGDYETSHLRNYLIALRQVSPDLMQVFLELVIAKVQMDTYFNTSELVTLLSFLNQKCFDTKSNSNDNLIYTYKFLICYYENAENDDQIKECLTGLFTRAAQFCKKPVEFFLRLVPDMGLDVATPFLRSIILFGVNYTRTIHETIIPRCPPYKSGQNVAAKVKAVKDCKLKAADVSARKDVVRIGYDMIGQKGQDDFTQYGFCQLDSYSLTLQISFDIIDKEGQIQSNHYFQFAIWINLKAAQAKAKKQAIEGAGVKNCNFGKEQFPFQQVLKHAELNTICNKTTQTIMACFGAAFNDAYSKSKGGLEIKDPSEFCLDKPFYDDPGDFVRIFRKPPVAIKPPEPIPIPEPEPEPEPEPPLFYSFTCKEFEAWINIMLKDSNIQELFNSMNGAFNTTSDKDPSQIDLQMFIELWKEFQLFCEEGQTSSFYKIGYPVDIQLSKMIYKYTSGYILFKNRIALRLSFYILTDSSKQKPNHPKPFNPDSTQFCFEVEKSLTNTFESYFECNIYPMIDPPLGSTDIPWDFNFQVYIYFMKTYFMYLWKLKKVIEYQLTPFEIYTSVFEGLHIKAKNLAHNIIMEKNGSLINQNGVFVNFKLEGFELIDFSLEIRNEGSYMIKTTIKTGYIEYHFYIYKFFEYGASFRGGKKIDMAAVEKKLQEIIKKFLRRDYLDMVKVFFVDILQIYNQDEYRALMTDMNYNIDVNYGVLKNYIFSDLMSFKVFTLLFQYHILQLQFDMIDLERFEGENLQQVMKDPQEFYYFKEGEKYDDQISSFQGITKADMIFDKPVSQQPEIIMKNLEKQLFKENNLNLQKPVYFLVGLPSSHTKILITVYHIGGDLIDAALIVIESQFYYKEVFIPFSAPFLISQKIVQILMETHKNELDYLHNYLFNKSGSSIDLTIESVKNLLEEANKLTGYKLPFCSVTDENSKEIDLFVGQPNLFKEFLNSNDYTETIQPCGNTEKMVKAMQISDTVYGGIPSIKITMTEPNKKAQKIKLDFAKGVFMKRNHHKKSMQTQFIFYKSRQKEESQLIRKFLISHLKHYVEDEFDKLDEDIENKIKDFFKAGNQFQLNI